MAGQQRRLARRGHCQVPIIIGSDNDFGASYMASRACEIRQAASNLVPNTHALRHSQDILRPLCKHKPRADYPPLCAMYSAAHASLLPDSGHPPASINAGMGDQGRTLETSCPHQTK
ncbi:hypothetical protein BaRGS_00033906 [Batillaria attramentaria]|uniref:Uncharacterized protein n=1 Tax=Batillaria attramentaria TaxID=370345 RepID=A0ABD0JIP7_9CAEN